MQKSDSGYLIASHWYPFCEKTGLIPKFQSKIKRFRSFLALAFLAVVILISFLRRHTHTCRKWPDPFPYETNQPWAFELSDFKNRIYKKMIEHSRIWYSVRLAKIVIGRLILGEIRVEKWGSKM